MDRASRRSSSRLSGIPLYDPTQGRHQRRLGIAPLFRPGDLGRRRRSIAGGAGLQFAARHPLQRRLAVRAAEHEQRRTAAGGELECADRQMPRHRGRPQRSRAELSRGGQIDMSTAAGQRDRRHADRVPGAAVRNRRLLQDPCRARRTVRYSPGPTPICCRANSKSYRPFFALADSVNGIQGTYPDPAQGWQTATAPALYRTDLEVRDGNRRLMAAPTFDFVPYPEQVQRLQQSRHCRGAARADPCAAVPAGLLDGRARRHRHLEFDPQRLCRTSYSGSTAWSTAPTSTWWSTSPRWTRPITIGITTPITPGCRPGRR